MKTARANGANRLVAPFARLMGTASKPLLTGRPGRGALRPSDWAAVLGGRAACRRLRRAFASQQLLVSGVVHFLDLGVSGVRDLLFAFASLLLENNRGDRTAAPAHPVADLERFAVPLRGKQRVDVVRVDPHH